MLPSDWRYTHLVPELRTNQKSPVAYRLQNSSEQEFLFRQQLTKEAVRIVHFINGVDYFVSRWRLLATSSLNNFYLAYFLFRILEMNVFSTFI